MPHPSPLPESLGPSFSTRQALSAGVGRERLRRLDLRAPYPGIRVSADQARAVTLLERAREYAPRLRPGQFYSHETALGLRGVPLPSTPFRPGLHVSAYRPAREPRVEGVVGHRLQVREPAWSARPLGFPLEHPVRAWRQAGATWHLDDLVAAADHMIAPRNALASIDELRAEIDLMGDRRGMLRATLALVRVGVRSPRETSLRLLLARGGLPRAEVNWDLRDRTGRFVAELDLAFPHWRVCAEYDGRVHELDRAQFARDVDRWDSIRGQDWQHVRIIGDHMKHGGREALRRVREALLRAGWRPS
ncbi:hypothetical protein M4I32_11395 [Microbacterium sp. LRZ72]|uniref:hypothetical protein n=1 Tax=Microbacterium sp. LRZ72 TaxID=2942481 RepID=UPI0029BF1A2E|nr:hypothetical protein [Microbacterium sp. LRZ72]MDX2377404.1 hypothetical protein [Microbacterium sp. LRZ72]